MNKIETFLSQLRFWKVASLSFLLGAVLATTFAPLHLVFFLPVCFSGLIILLKSSKTKWQAFFIGWWFGWGQFIAGLYWIGVAFTIDANTHAALIPLPVLALPAFLAIFPGLAALATHLTQLRGIFRIFAFAGFWVLAEYGRGILFTGFPWNLAGYSWGNILPMLQWVAFIGIYGLTLLTVLASSLPAILVEKKSTRRLKNTVLLADCLLIAAMVTVGYLRLSTPMLANLPQSQIRVVQPNIPQAEKWKPDKKFAHVQKLVDLSSTKTTTPLNHLIWPETAIPFFLETDENLKFYLQRITPSQGSLVSGAPRKDPETKQYWNSVQALDAKGEISAIYDKAHLVPYGEYMPLRKFFVTSGLASLIPALDQMSDFSFPENPASSVINIPGLDPARVLICYEVAFPWEVEKDDNYRWILNVTNDAWFGNTSGPYQHFVTTKTRAIEQGMSVIRAANTGISAVIDGYGRILHSLPLNESGAIDSAIPVPLKGITLYRQTGEIGPLFLTFLLIGGSLLGRRKRRSVCMSN